MNEAGRELSVHEGATAGCQEGASIVWTLRRSVVGPSSFGPARSSLHESVWRDLHIHVCRLQIR